MQSGRSVGPTIDRHCYSTAGVVASRSTSLTAINSSCSFACVAMLLLLLLHLMLLAAINARQIDVATWLRGLRTIQQPDCDPQQRTEDIV